jgi:hypothetical protein
MNPKRIKGPFRTRSFRKFIRGGQSSPTTGIQPVTTAATTSPIALIKVPADIKNFKFSAAVSTLPATFGTFVPTVGTFVPGVPDDSTFTIKLNSKYTSDNLPQFLVTGYIYSSTAGYIQVQRQFGIHAAVGAAGIAINPAVNKITFTNLTKTNFPSTGNDAKGYALYIAFQILN